jgi:Putative adhesin
MISRFSQFKTTILVLSVVFFFGLVSEASAQKKFSTTYVAQKNVRIQLMNRSGTVTVEGWNKDKIQIEALMEAPAALIEPQNLSGTIVINVVKDNQGRTDVGNVNFRIRVPFAASVDIQTMIGNLNVSNISGGVVRAHITSEGDITLTNIVSGVVSAENVIGDIFFDGELKAEGRYRFSSTRGNININIPLNSNFKLVATAPSTRSISLGSLANNSGFKFVSDGRRVIGTSGNGNATINITNQRGNIAFLSR